jgi:hypothetical protein
MRKYSLTLLVLLGALLAVAGTLEFLREVEIVNLSLKTFGGVLVVVLGLWVIVCAVECGSSSYQQI